MSSSNKKDNISKNNKDNKDNKDNKNNKNSKKYNTRSIKKDKNKKSLPPKIDKDNQNNQDNIDDDNKDFKRKFEEINKFLDNNNTIFIINNNENIKNEEVKLIKNINDLFSSIKNNKNNNPKININQIKNNNNKKHKKSDIEYIDLYDDDEYDDDEYDDDEYDDDEYNDDDEYEEENEIIDGLDEELYELKNMRNKLNKNNDLKDFKNEIKSRIDLLKKNEKDIIANPNFEKYSAKEIDYFLKLSKKNKKKVINIEKIANKFYKEEIPLRFRILNSNINDNLKSIALKKVDYLNTISERSSEYFRTLSYIENLCKIPCGIYKKLQINNKNTPDKISNFLNKSYNILSDNVYGHNKSKKQIIQIIAQWISNPRLKGNVIGIHGHPGVGKTRLIKEGLSKALNIPFVFIPLGGVNDSAYLTGHSFTYEGAIHGKIVDSLMKAGCMNPIIYFDELDKVSNTSKGDEIINTLIHLTDQTQNNKFYDKYFYDIPLDLSKALIIFTYNNDHLINPILKDRMIRINTDDYTKTDKLNIAQNYLIPEIMKDFNISEDLIYFTKDIIEYVINKTEKEKGVRNLRRSLETIISNLNLLMLTKTNNNNFTSIDFNIIFPVKINEKIVDKLIVPYDAFKNTSIEHLYL
jgi:ATP-dependent Lon protease